MSTSHLKRCPRPASEAAAAGQHARRDLPVQRLRRFLARSSPFRLSRPHGGAAAVRSAVSEPVSRPRNCGSPNAVFPRCALCPRSAPARHAHACPLRQTTTSRRATRLAAAPLGRPRTQVRSASRFLRVARPLTRSGRAAPGFAQPPGLGYRVPDAAPSLQSSAFPSVPTPQPPAASSGGGSLFSLKPYAVYFDVDTADVLHRMRLACVPFGSSFMTTVQDKPDLCVASPLSALRADAEAAPRARQVRPVLDSCHASVHRGCRWKPVFVSGVPQARGHHARRGLGVRHQEGFAFCGALLRVHQLPAAFGASARLPGARFRANGVDGSSCPQLYLALRYWATPTSFTALVTLYGYSLVVYLPIAVRRVLHACSANVSQACSRLA